MRALERAPRGAGAAITCRIAGEGAPVALLHGLSGSWRWWRPVVPRLAHSYRVHVVDLPGFGVLRRRHGHLREAVDGLADWLHETRLGPVHLVGHSLGGLVAARLAARRPDAVASLALVAPAGVPMQRSFLGHLPSLVASLRFAPVRLGAHLAADALRAGAVNVARGAVYTLTQDVRPELAQIRAPTLLVWGERDPLIPSRLAADWLRGIPQARVRTLPGAGHVPMLERPSDLAETLLEFLAQAEGPDARNGAATAARARAAP